MIEKHKLVRQSIRPFTKRICRKTTLELMQSLETETSQTQWKYKSTTQIPDFPIVEQPEISNHYKDQSKVQWIDFDNTNFEEDQFSMENNWPINSSSVNQTYFDYDPYSTAQIIDAEIKLNKNPILIGGEQFLTKIKIFDSQGQNKYIQVIDKLIQTKVGLFWDFSTGQQNLLYTPNCMILPSGSFLLRLQMQALKGEFKYNKETITFSFNTENNVNKNFKICSSFQEFHLEIQCEKVYDVVQKVQLVNSLNFKIDQKLYLNSDLIKINHMKISLDAQGQTCQDASDQVDSHQVIENLKTQMGSKNYQKQLKSMDAAKIGSLIVKIQDHLVQLINNEYANYFMQQLFAILGKQHKKHILLKLQSSIKDLICSPYGTFVFQAFIDYFQSEQQYEIIVDGVKQNIINLCFDQNASHLIRKLLNQMPIELLCQFRQVVEEYFLDLCENRHAVCVVKNYLRRLIQNDTLDLTQMRQSIIMILCYNLTPIIVGEYSNYIVQQICQKFKSQQIQDIHSLVAANFFYYERNKYSTIILTKFLRQYWKYEQMYLRIVVNNTNEMQLQSLKYTKQGQKLVQQLRNCIKRETDSNSEKKSCEYRKKHRKYIKN